MSDTSTPSDPSVVDPFAIVSALHDQNQTTVDRAQHADSVLTNFIQANDQIQKQREENLKQVVAAKQVVNDTVQQKTQDFTSTVQPIFQRRAAIADREAEIAAMNPFQRFVKGLTDRGYQPTELARADAAAKDQLAAQGQMYQTTMQTQGTILQGIQDGYDNNDAILKLASQDGQQDVQLQTQLAGSAAQVFSAQLEGLSAQSDVVRAQSMARQNLLSGMTEEQVNQALGQAQANGGVATVNGVPLRQGELKDLQMSWQDKNLALQSRQVALQAGRIDLANAQEAKLISHMSGLEIQTAVANGGKYRGQMLNQELLTRALAADAQKQQVVADQATQATGIPVAVSAIQSLGQNQTFLAQRSQGIFGQVPREVEQQGLSIAARISSYQEGLAKATASGAGAAYVAQNQPALAAMQNEQRTLVDTLAKRFSTDKNVQDVATGWLTGQPISGESAVKGAIALARTGLPPGTKLSPTAQSQFDQIKAMVQQNDAGSAGSSIASLADVATGGRSAAQREASLVTNISSALQSGYNNIKMNQVIRNTPTIAAQVKGADGKPLAISRVPVQEFNNAIQQGDDHAYEVIGRALNLNAADVRTLFTDPRQGSSPVFQKAQAGHKDITYSGLTQQFNTLSSQQTMVSLDSTSVAHDGFRPSLAYVQAMNSPDFQTAVSNGITNQTQSNLGEFIIGNIAPNSFNQTLFNHAQSLQRDYGKVQNGALQERARVAPEVLGNGVRFADAAIGAVPGITDAEHQALYRAVVGKLQNQAGYRPIGLDSPANAGPDVPSDADQIDAIITQGKFDDPAIESVRRKAAAAWEQSKASARRTLNALTRGG